MTSVDVRCRPIDDWKGQQTPDQDRRASPFKASWNTIMDDLRREMDLLDASEATIGLSVAAHQIRADGWPRGDARVEPPVALVFDDNLHGLTLRYQCDRWNGWQGNLRAISLTLTRLRLVAEAGVGVGDEAYRGFAALPPGTTALGAGVTEADALRVLGAAANLRLLPDDGPEALRAAYKIAARACHPDAGGDPEEWVRVEAAYRMLVAS